MTSRVLPFGASVRCIQLACLAAAFLCASGTPVLAGDGTVTFYDGAFLPSVVTIVQGETVHFTWKEGDHLLTSGASSDPADDPGALFEVAIDEDNPVFSYTFNDAGIYAFFDALNEIQVGAVIVEIFFKNVKVLDSVYDPLNVIIFEGEEVRWIFDGDLEHTVTNGYDLIDPTAGKLFDALINFDTPTFEYIFEEPGVLPYFCVPHLFEGMVATVTIQRRFLRGDVDDNDRLNIGDPILILTYAFLASWEPTCLDALDTNDDGAIGLVDALRTLNYLFASGAPPEKPFPIRGADRTDDDNLCQ